MTKEEFLEKMAEYFIQPGRKYRIHEMDHHFNYTAEERDFLLKHAFTLFYKRFQTFTYHGDSKPDFRSARIGAARAIDQHITASPRAANPLGREPQPDQGGLPEETGTSGPDTSQVGIPCFTNSYGLDLGRIQTGNWVVSGIHSVPEPVTHSSPAPIAGISNGTQRIISDITEAIASFERNLEDLEF